MNVVITTVGPIPYEGEFVVEIHLDGNLWDHRVFPTEAEAQAFIADPLAADRKRSNQAWDRESAREAEHAKYRAAGYERISRGKRIGPKPGAG